MLHATKPRSQIIHMIKFTISKLKPIRGDGPTCAAIY